MKKLEHLAEICSSYNTFVIDLWGVMHNGISLNYNAVEAVDNLLAQSKKIVFLSNAPRPSANVVEFLKKMKMSEKFLSNVVTSGEAAMYAINQNRFGELFYHLGPKRDESIFQKVKKNQTKLDNCDFILCTGLFDEYENDLNYYKKLLEKHTLKKMICTNPDLTVHRGIKEEYCAGYIAQVFESIGGQVIYFGKPYEEIYKMCFNKSDKVLAIGDNLRTDIRGANNLNIDSIFIYSGVHRNEFVNEKELFDLCNKYNVKTKFFQPMLRW